MKGLVDMSDALPSHIVARVELWTVGREATELGLLRAFRAPVLPAVFDLNCLTWSAGQATRQEPPDLSSYIKWLDGRRFNESVIQFRFGPTAWTEPGLTLSAIEFRFRESPTSARWESPYGSRGRSRDAERMRMFHESLERSIKWNGVKSCPTALEVEFSFSSKSTRPEFYLRFASVLAQGLVLDSVPNYLGCAYLTGGGELGFFERLAPWARAFPSLYWKFDGLHPIMIGPASLCKGIRESITEGIAGTEVNWWQVGRDVEILQLPDSVLVNKHACKVASHFLIEKSIETQSAKADESSQEGDFRFGPALFHTARRYEQLVAQGQLPSSDNRYVYFPLIAPEYCRAIGVDPAAMLVTAAPAKWVEELQDEIKSLLGRTAGTDIERDKIYAVHEAVYRERYGVIPGLYTPFWEYMKSTYFAWRK
jgi:hypothetical protein